MSEIQITTRCYYWAFRGTQLVVASETTRRFDLIDLKVMHRSQFRRDEPLPLHVCADEAAPELIQWPLDICSAGVEISARAINSARVAEGDDDLGVTFEMILLGELL